MRLSIKCFALARQIVGAEAVDLELPENSTVAELKKRMAAEYPEMERVLASSMIAVNGEYVSEQYVLSAGEELACIPPVSGG